MAKLSVHGHEVWRLSKEGGRAPNPLFETCIWERLTFVIMSDGWILTKLDAKFLSPNGKPQAQSFGWKRRRKLAKDETPEILRDHLISKGYK